MIVTLTNNLREGGGLHVEHDGAFLDARPQLKEAVQGQRGHVGFTPALASFLHLLLELDPPGRTKGGEGEELRKATDNHTTRTTLKIVQKLCKRSQKTLIYKCTITNLIATIVKKQQSHLIVYTNRLPGGLNTSNTYSSLQGCTHYTVYSIHYSALSVILL